MTDMSIVTDKSIAFDTEGFDSFLAARKEPDWMLDLRREAWRHFDTLDWPSQRNEEWMRTNIRTFKLDRYALAPQPLGPQPASVLDQGVELAGRSIAVDGQPLKTELDSRWSDQGVLFGSLAEMLALHEDVLRPHFQSIFQADYDRFSALHAAFWSSGTVLYVPRGVRMDLPVHLFSGINDGGTDLGHTLVILEEGAEATVLAECASPSSDSGGLHCGAVELIVGPRAHLRYVNLQDWGQGTWHFAHQKATVDQDATLQWTAGALGSRLSKVNQHVEMVGAGANVQVNGVIFAENRQHLAYHTLQHHRAPSCTSDFLYKAALQGESRTVWRGMIKVDPHAQKTDGYQRNDNLMLSHDARADSIPGLEIEADDVRCTHGSTSGRVDEELIFYARTRGFTRKEAVQMIVTGFFQQVLDRITIDSVREALGQAIRRRVRDYA